VTAERHIQAPTPNFDARVAPPDMIVLHYTGMASGEAALERLRDPASKVSAHYLIEEDGRVFVLVPEARRAWHAGVSSWAGATDINGFSIGVELVNPGHEFGYRPFPERQIAALVTLLAEIRSRWTVPDERILAHSDVAPARKQDPGELFPWHGLAQAGHGLWAEAGDGRGPALDLGDEGLGVAVLQAGLTRLGYDCPPTGHYGAETATIVRAFQRHWSPASIDGTADGDTRVRLMALLRRVRA